MNSNFTGTLITRAVKKSSATEAIRHDLERASEKYAVSKSETAFRNGNETCEDNDTSVQSQHPLVGETGNEGSSGRTSEG